MAAPTPQPMTPPPTTQSSDARADEARKRRHPRHDINFLVQYRSDSFEEFTADYAVNLSVGGMFVRTERPREVGELIYFQFLLRDGVRLIEGLGRVVWTRGKGQSREPGMGIEFHALDDDMAALIARLLADRPETPYT